MKRIFFFLLLSGNFCAQNFTNGSVYNYSVGDTIVTETTSYSGMSGSSASINYQVFTGKRFSANNDSIYYESLSYIYTPVNCMTCTASWQQFHNTFAITNLTLSAINYSFTNKDSCEVMKDSGYVNNCGLHEHRKYLKGQKCQEGPSLEDKIIEGVGKLSYYRCWNCTQTGSGWSSELKALHKIGGVKCGNVSFKPVGLSEKKHENPLAVVPNPGYGLFKLSFNGTGKLFVTNPLGQIVLTEKITEGENSVDLTNYEAGIYTFTLRSSGGSFSKKVVKQ